MSRAYSKRYGAPADVLYPSRAPECPDFKDPPARLATNQKRFTIAFTGTINSNAYVRAILALQDALKPIRGRLLIFGPLTSNEAQRFALDHPNTEVCGLVSPTDLLTRLREEADALFVPMSFDSSDRTNMEMAFPSKLADCTAAGLPLSIYGPPYCSAVTWARENPGVAELVEVEGALRNAIDRLAKDPAHRVALAKRALEVGRQYFTYERIQQQFHQFLSV